MPEFEITKRNLLRGAAVGAAIGTMGFSAAHAQDLPKSQGSVALRTLSLAIDRCGVGA